MDSDDKLFLKDISEKLDHIAAQTIDPIEEIRKNIEEKIGPIHHVYPYTVEERLDMITEKLEQMGHDVFANKDLHIHVNGFQHSFHERVPVDLEERLDQIEFQLKSLTALVSLLCTHFGVKKPLKQKKEDSEEEEEEDESEDPEPL